MSLKDTLYKGSLGGLALAIGMTAQPVTKPQSLSELLTPKRVYAKNCSLSDFNVESPTDLNPEKLRNILKDYKIVFIYWKIKGAVEEKEGERFFGDFMCEYGTKIDRVLLMDGLKYGYERWSALKDVLDEVNPKETDSSRGVPMYSIGGFGKEVRIRGPPKEPYEQKYEKLNNELKPVVNWFELRKREKFLHSG